MENNTFKSSLFGGFRRKDVIDYIEKSAGASKERIASLEQNESKLAEENENLRRELASANEALNENQAAQAALRAELDAANRAIAEAKEALEAKRGEADTLAGERDSLRTKTEQLQEQVGKLAPQVEAYRCDQASLAQLELEARQRADAYEKEAHERADAYEREVRERADAYERETRERAESYEREKRESADAYVSDVKKRLRDFINSSVRESELIISTLNNSRDSLSQLPDAFRAVQEELSVLDK